MAERELNIIIRAKDKATGVFKKFGSFLASKFVITLGDVTRAMRAVTGAIGDVINAAKKQEDAVNEMNEALKQTGQFTPEASKALQENASALQKLTTTGDETILKVQQLLIQFGKVSTDQVPAATKAVLGLAAAQGIDLNSSALLVAKSLGSSTNALTRYGIEIDNSLKGTDRFNALIGQMAPLFGSATAQAETFSGRIQQISNTFGDQLEVIGFAITKNKELNETLGELNKSLSSTQLSSDIAQIVSGIVSLGVAALKVIPILQNVALNTKLAFAASTGNLQLVQDTIGQMQDLAAQRALNAAQDARFAEIEKTRGKEFVQRLKAQIEETRAANAVTAQDRAAGEQRIADAENKSIEAAKKKKAALLDEVAAAGTLTEKLKLLTQAEKDEADAAEGSADAATKAANALGIRIAATAKLNEEARIAALREQLALLERLNEESRGEVITSQELLRARTNFNRALRGETIPALESIARATDGAAKKTRDLAAAQREAATASDTQASALARAAEKLGLSADTIARLNQELLVQELTKALDALTIGFEAGEVKASELALAQRNLAAAIRGEVIPGLNAAGVAANQFKDALGNAGEEGGRRFAEGVEAGVARAVAVTVAGRQAIVNVPAGATLGQRTTGSRFSIFDSTGQRIGSRLARSPRSARQSRFSSSLTTII